MIKILKFLNLMDDSGLCISLTNLGLFAILVKIVFAKDVDYPSLIALVSTLANYMHKRSTLSESQDASK